MLELYSTFRVEFQSHLLFCCLILFHTPSPSYLKNGWICTIYLLINWLTIPFNFPGMQLLQRSSHLCWSRCNWPNSGTSWTHCGRKADHSESKCLSPSPLKNERKQWKQFNNQFQIQSKTKMEWKYCMQKLPFSRTRLKESYHVTNISLYHVSYQVR